MPLQSLQAPDLPTGGKCRERDGDASISPYDASRRTSFDGSPGDPLRARQGCSIRGGNGSCGECAHSAVKGKVSKFFESSYNLAMVDGKIMCSAIVYLRVG
jgi:hypothetical protein